MLRLQPLRSVLVDFASDKRREISPMTDETPELDAIATERMLEQLRLDMARVGSCAAPPCPACLVANAVAPAAILADWRCGRCLTFWDQKDGAEPKIVFPE